MRNVRGKNTTPEMRVRSALYRAGYRFRLHRKDLPGRPDIVLPRLRAAIFVHGCFWHRHPGCRAASSPSTRAVFWQEKFARNVERDRRTIEALEADGWRVHVVWECETKGREPTFWGGRRGPGVTDARGASGDSEWRAFGWRSVRRASSTRRRRGSRRRTPSTILRLRLRMVPLPIPPERGGDGASGSDAGGGQGGGMSELVPSPSPSPAPSPAPRREDRPAHYRLSTETWELILQEYREGATAPFLARKWRVSEHAIRRRITRHGATKRAWGDAQAIGQALAREAELEEARRNSPEAVAARLFEGVDEGEGEADGDPAALLKVAVLASGRAMRGRLWAEAKALAGLAESYARLARAEGGAGAGRQDAEGEPDWDDAAELEAVRRKVEDMRRGSVEIALRAAAEGRDPWAAAQVPRPDWAGPEEPGEAAGDAAGDAATAAPTAW